MEKDTEKKCAYCKENDRKEGTSFCSRFCFECWYSLYQAEMLIKVLDTIFDEYFESVGEELGVMNAKSRVH